MRKIVVFLLLISLVLTAQSIVFAQELKKKPKLTTEEELSRQQTLAINKQLEDELKINQEELEQIRKQEEEEVTRQMEQVQIETDLAQKNLEAELKILWAEAEREAGLRRRELQAEEAQAIKEALEEAERQAVELEMDIRRIKLKPPRP